MFKKIIFIFILLLLASHSSVASEVAVASGIKSGLCVQLGVSDGKGAIALADDGKFVVHGLATSASSLVKAQKYIQAKGVYGQVSVSLGSLAKLPYADNLVNLVVLDDVSKINKINLNEVVRILTPNGAFCFKGIIPASKLKSAGLGAVKNSGAWSVAIKPWPKGMDGWPSFDYDPSGNPVSKDSAVGPVTNFSVEKNVITRRKL